MSSNEGQNQISNNENRSRQDSHYRENHSGSWRTRGTRNHNSYNRFHRNRRIEANSGDSRGASSTVHIIDLNDSTQWPSILEVSAGRDNSGRISVSADTGSENRVESQDMVELNVEIDSLRIGGITTSNSTQSTKQNDPQQVATGCLYQNRHSLNYRGRGGRYGGPGRGYSAGYNRRYSRFPNPGFVPPVVHDQVYTGYMNGNLVFNPVPVNYIVDNNKNSKAMRQVEYYFSPQNLEHDYYLRSKMDSDGWVDLNLIYQFNRVQQLEIAFEEFVNSLLPSEHLEIDVESKRIRAFPDHRRWVYDTSATNDSQTSYESTSIYPMSESSYMYPVAPVNTMVMGINPGYPVQPNRGRYYPQPVCVIQAPFYGYQCPDFPADIYYQCYSPPFFPPYTQDMYSQGQNNSTVTGENGSPEEMGDSTVVSQVNQDNAQPPPSE